MEGFLEKHPEQKYFIDPFKMSSLCSGLIFTQAKCSKLPQLEHKPTADLFWGFNPWKLHTFAAHFTSPLLSVISSSSVGEIFITMEEQM